MKKVLLGLVLSLICSVAFANHVDGRHTFFNSYNPSTQGSYVYDSTGSTGTGDVVAVNTYPQKTIFINDNSTSGKLVSYSVEGRSDGTSSNDWSVLYTGSFRGASANNVKHIAVNVLENLDFIRVGLKQVDGDTSANAVDVDGLFVNTNRPS